VVIKRSAAQEIQALLADLEGNDDVRREAAIARLAVIGPRAVDRLLTAASPDHAALVRRSVFRALEGIASPRATDAAVRATDDADPAVAVAAVGVLRALLQDAEAGTTALDCLAALSVDEARSEPVRLAALDALSDVPSAVVSPILSRLRQDVSAAVRQHAAGEQRNATAEAAALIEAAVAGGHIPDDPGGLRAAVIALGADVPLPTLHRLVEITRGAEAAEASADRQGPWNAARAAVHRALAARGSRVALYDLRETVEGASGPIAVEFVSALEEIGDVSCLESIAAAHARAAATPGTDWWRQHLVAAFHAIAAREGVTRRHAVIKRIQGRWGDAAAPLLKRR
jgi:HEAT repeat protein